MSARFVMREADGTIRSFEVHDGSKLGSGQSSDVRVKHADVAPVHARIVMENGKLTIKSDSPGLQVNGQPMQAHALQHLDIVTLGPSGDIVFMDSGKSRSSTRIIPAQTMAAQQREGVVVAPIPVFEVTGIVQGDVVTAPLPLTNRSVQPGPAPEEPETMLGKPVIIRVRLVGTDDTFESPPGICIVGRGPEAQFRILSKTVSRGHARITITDDTVTVQDLTSANGTKVNETALTAATELKAGDKVSFAAFEFRVEIQKTGGVR